MLKRESAMSARQAGERAGGKAALKGAKLRHLGARKTPDRPRAGESIDGESPTPGTGLPLEGSVLTRFPCSRTGGEEIRGGDQPLSLPSLSLPPLRSWRRMGRARVNVNALSAANALGSVRLEVGSTRRVARRWPAPAPRSQGSDAFGPLTRRSCSRAGG